MCGHVKYLSIFMRIIIFFGDDREVGDIKNVKNLDLLNRRFSYTWGYTKSLLLLDFFRERTSVFKQRKTRNSVCGLLL